MLDWLKRFRRESQKPASPAVTYGNLWAGEANVLAVERPLCNCLEAQYQEFSKRRWRNLSIHCEEQDTTSPAWNRLLELVDRAAKDGREEFAPGREMDATEWTTIVTLPRSIAQLKSVKHLNLYGSSLMRLPPEIGEMSKLEKFSPYTSYRLHWFPYEIVRCRNLADSTVSTRALYGNYKYRPAFPKLPQSVGDLTPKHCSVCDGPFLETSPIQRWISVRVATDVLPLLVHACSEDCIGNLPIPPENYIATPHSGGPRVQQPAVDSFYE